MDEITISNVEASLARYLYENLTVPFGIKVFEDILGEDPKSITEWVVIDSLSNPLGYLPVQHWFIHIATHMESPNLKHKLNVLVDKVKNILEVGTPITLYSYDTGEVLGTMWVNEVSLGHSLAHRSGGMVRVLTLSCTY